MSVKTLDRVTCQNLFLVVCGLWLLLIWLLLGFDSFTFIFGKKFRVTVAYLVSVETEGSSAWSRFLVDVLDEISRPGKE